MSEGQAAPPDAWGIIPGFEDADGRWRETPAATHDALVEAMGGDPRADGPPPTDDAVLVLHPDTGHELDAPATLVLEDGTRREVGHTVPGDLPLGYHELRVAGRDTPTRLIVSPGTCHLPDDLRWWGVAVQLYAAWSHGSEGIGDFADLRLLAHTLAGFGADALMVNPTGAAVATTPRDASPYLPSSRRMLDWLSLRVAEVPGRGHRRTGAAASRGAHRPRPRRRRQAGRPRGRLRRRGRRPGAGCLAGRGGPGRDRLRPVVGGRRAARRRLARLARRPAPPRRRRHGPRWRARTRGACGSTSGCSGARTGSWPRRPRPLHLLRDLPVGASPHGFDAWIDQDLLADGVTVGAPPDALGPHGQDWQLPAYVPWKLRAAGYEPLARTIRASLRHAGALRIDHALGLFRLFWIPPGGTPADGAYVAQPTGDLFDVLALESHRAGAVIVGEDLGTVGAGVRRELHERRMLRYHVGWFEDEPPSTWAPDALASLSTHDLPTVAGVWTGEDEAELERIGQDPDAGFFQRLRWKLAAIAGDGYAPLDDVLVAAHRWLASAPSAIVLGQLEDLLGVTTRPNVPGTQPPTRANWAHPLPRPLEELADDARARAILDALGS